MVKNNNNMMNDNGINSMMKNMTMNNKPIYPFNYISPQNNNFPINNLMMNTSIMNNNTKGNNSQMSSLMNNTMHNINSNNQMAYIAMNNNINNTSNPFLNNNPLLSNSMQIPPSPNLSNFFNNPLVSLQMNNMCSLI